MSGPKSAHYSFRARRRAEEDRIHNEKLRRQEQLEVIVRRCTDVEARVEQLSEAIKDFQRQYPTESLSIASPQIRRPNATDLDSLTVHLNRLESWLTSTAEQLKEATSQATGNEAFRRAVKVAQSSAPLERRTAAKVIEELTHSALTIPSHSASVERKAVLDRILSRLPSDMTIPSAIAGLAARFLSAVGAGDAESLAIELRLQVQHLSDRRKQQERDQRDARSLMARLDPETSPEIRAVERELGLVQAGFTEMTSDLRIRAEAAIADATAELARAERAEAAAILASSLGDLGYEVSPIESTLFLQGGAAYFKKTGWDQYCVRLVVRPADEGINFNVIRVITETDETRVESRLADKEIENEWCGDLPQLIDVLSSRGIDLKLTREIPSGALPVPVAKPDEVAALFGVVGRRHFREKRSSSRPSRSKRR